MKQDLYTIDQEAGELPRQEQDHYVDLDARRFDTFSDRLINL